MCSPNRKSAHAGVPLFASEFHLVNCPKFTSDLLGDDSTQIEFDWLCNVCMCIYRVYIYILA